MYVVIVQDDEFPDGEICEYENGQKLFNTKQEALSCLGWLIAEMGFSLEYVQKEKPYRIAKLSFID